MTIARGGVEQDVQVTPELNAGRGRIGINIGEDVTRIKPGPIDAHRDEPQAQLRIGRSDLQ